MRRLLLIALLVGVAVGVSVNAPKPRGFKVGTGPSNDPISTTPPSFPGGSIAVDAPPGPFFADFDPPFPTDAWWSGLTVANQDSTVAGPFPFQSVTRDTGLDFGISTARDFDGTSVHQRTLLEWRASFTGLPANLNNRKATGWDTQVVCLQYGGAGASMDTCLVPGSPYMTLTYTNAQVVLTSLQDDIIDFSWVTPGRKAKVTNGAGTYLLYVVQGTLTDFTVGPETLTSSPGFTGTIRLAKVVEASQEAILDTHSSPYPTGVSMSYSVVQNAATVTWKWDVVNGIENDLLMLSWPHHRKNLVGPNNVDIQYLTIKGYMKGIRGSTWTQSLVLPTIDWFPESPVHPSCLGELTKTLEADVNNLQVMVPGDFYFWGGAFGRAAQMATIAEQIGRTDLVNQVVDILKESIGHWFDPAHTPAAAFETGWGGFINKDGWNNTWVDFGNAYYNDHHFHYGYLMHGAAVIGKYDQAWLNEHLDFLNHVARDYGNPSPNDPHYTVTRHMDFFAGHSWASGIANGAGPRDQESSGEAINGYYGLLLFAKAANNQALVDWARLLVAIEVNGAQAYWQLLKTVQDPDTAYPEQGLRDLVTIGNVMDTQAGAWLFWGAEKIQIAAIQILPLTPMGMYTYNPDWLVNVVPYCKEELDDPKYGDDFKSVIFAAHAKINPQEAAQYSSNLFDWGSGNSATNQLYFVATQTSGSDICTASTQSPEGTFTIEDVATGRFVTVGGNGHLSASIGADVLATPFVLAFKPGGGTLQSTSNEKYVTASPDAAGALSAIRDTAQSYETFRWEQLPDGTYELTAMVNRQKVSAVDGSGELINNGVASKFRLTPAQPGAPAPVPAQGVLKNVANSQYVVSDPVLRATGANAGAGTTFAFARVAGSPDSSPVYSIQNTVSQQYVTGSPDGVNPLSATSGTVQAWEHFKIVAYQGSYIIVHVASGFAVAAQPDNTLIDNNTDVGQNALWTIE